MIDTLLQIQQAPNLTPMLSEDELNQLGERVVREYELDESSREEWLKRSERSMEIALQVQKEKSSPWPGAANVKYPLLTVAALQFHARAYPALAGDSVVKSKVTGKDPDGSKGRKADRIEKHMNYQLSEEMPEWEEQMDALLLALPIEGVEFKKTYFDPMKRRNVSEWVRPKDLVVNYGAKSLEDVPRITHLLTDVYPYQIKERQASGVYADVDLRLSSEDDEQEKPQEILEQHRFEDLDEDGVKEPYIVTVHKESHKVLRIKACFEPEGILVSDGIKTAPLFKRVGTETVINADPFASKLVAIRRSVYFTRYLFLPSPDGGFYGTGFGTLTGPLNEVIDTLTNQILDAGTLANMPMGLVSEGLKFSQTGSGSGELRFKPGEFKKVKAGGGNEIASQIYQFQFPGPSPVLFNLLGSLIEAVKDITSVKDIMTGESPANETATTTMARIEQGLKVFSAIYKRVYRALKTEFRLLKRLNAVYLEPVSYFVTVDSPEPLEVQILDYQGDDTDVQPVADPSVATTMQKMAKAQLGMSIAQGNPHVNGAEATKFLLEAAEMPENLFIAEPPPPPPDPRMAEVMAKVEKMSAETQKIQAEIAEMVQRLDLDKFKIDLDGFKATVEALSKLGPMMGGMSDPGGVGEMETAPGDEVVFPADQDLEGGIPPGALSELGEPVQDPGAEGFQ